MANSGSEVIMVHSEGRLKYGADRQKALNKAITELNKQGKRVVNIVDGPLQPFGPLGNVFCYVTILWEEDASSSQSAAAGAEKTAVPQPATINVTAENFASILTRIDLFLEDGDWDTALAYCEAALNFDATNATVYTKKLLAEVHASSIEELYTRTASFGENKSYEKAVRFADDKLKARLQEANGCVTNNIVEWSQLNIEASKLLQSAIDSKDDPVEAKKLLDSAQKIYVRIPPEFQRSIGLDSVTECNKVQRIIQAVPSGMNSVPTKSVLTDNAMFLKKFGVPLIIIYSVGLIVGIAAKIKALAIVGAIGLVIFLLGLPSALKKKPNEQNNSETKSNKE